MGLTSKRRSILIVIGAAVILIVMGMLLSNVSGKKNVFQSERSFKYNLDERQDLLVN